MATKYGGGVCECAIWERESEGIQRGSRSACVVHPDIKSLCMYMYSMSVHLFVSPFSRKPADEKGRAT